MRLETNRKLEALVGKVKGATHPESRAEHLLSLADEAERAADREIAKGETSED